MSLVISGTDGISDVDGSAATPAVRGTDANTGIFFGADTVGISTNGTTAVTVSSGQVVTLAQPLPVASGGTGAASNAAAPFALKGANSDITQLSGLSTALSIAQGGTGNTTATAAFNALVPSQTGNSGRYLTTNGTSASWGVVSADYVAKAWVNFNGTGTVAIRASGNVSSISDNGTGDYTVNFTTAVADSNFAYLVSGGGPQSGTLMNYTGSTVTSSSFRYNLYYPQYQAGGTVGAFAQDASTQCVTIFR
jgi:hypothetical protein